MLLPVNDHLPKQPHLDSAKTVFESSRFNLLTVEMPKNSGGTQTRGVAHTRDAVIIVPMLDAHTLVLIDNQRLAIGRSILEIPAGTIEPARPGEANEDPIACAHRELEEEAGYRAGTMRPLTRVFPSPGFMTETMHAFIATDLTHVGQSLDETEQITPVVVPIRDALTMIQSGKIQDAKTIAMILFAKTFVFDPQNS